MHTHCYLASIAKLEFDALVRDTERAISSLEGQRESAMQAIEAVRQANENPGHLSDETRGLVAGLLDRLGRLNATLDEVVNQIERQSHR
jgi:hypothetical protein